MEVWKILLECSLLSEAPPVPSTLPQLGCPTPQQRWTLACVPSQSSQNSGVPGPSAHVGPAPPSCLGRTCVPIVLDSPLLLLVIAREGEGPQVWIHLCLGGDNVDGGLAVLLAVTTPMVWP